MKRTLIDYFELPGGDPNGLNIMIKQKEMDPTEKHYHKR